MRTSILLFPVAISIIGCGPGPDPELAASCEDRPPAEMLVGTGEDEFEPVNQTIVVQAGPAGQGAGSYHIWFGLRCRNLGPHLVGQLSVTDVATGQLLTQDGFRLAVDLEYQPDQHADEVAGVRGYLLAGYPDGSDDPTAIGGSSLLGRQIKMKASVEDACKRHMESEVTATVSGYHQL